MASIKTRYKSRLPQAPEPTKAVRTEEKGILSDYNLIPPKELEEKLRKARENSYASRTDAWKDSEVQLLKDMVRAGYDIPAIAAKLPNRTETAVDSKVRKLRKKGEI